MEVKGGVDGQASAEGGGSGNQGDHGSGGGAMPRQGLPRKAGSATSVLSDASGAPGKTRPSLHGVGAGGGGGGSGRGFDATASVISHFSGTGSQRHSSKLVINVSSRVSRGVSNRSLNSNTAALSPPAGVGAGTPSVVSVAGSAGGVGHRGNALLDVAQSTLAGENLTEAQRLRIRAAFDTFDNDGTGFITAKDLRPLLQYLGDHPSSKELQELIILVDADGNGVIDFDEFMALVVMRSRHAHTEAQVVDAFKMFDEEGNGTVPVDRMRHALRHLIGMRDANIDTLIQEAIAVSGDKDVIHYREFVHHLMTAF